MKADAEWGKLGQVPGLVDGWTDVKDKAGIATEEFKAGDLCSSACGSHATIFPDKKWFAFSVIIPFFVYIFQILCILCYTPSC